jgi:hypothetical protein
MGKYIKKLNKYKSLEEQSRAAIALGIKNRTEYRKRHGEDPRLNSDVDQKKGFPGWIKFFGRIELYSTEKVIKIILRQKLSSVKRYNEAREKDKKLPSLSALYKRKDFREKYREIHYYHLRMYYKTCKKASSVTFRLGIISTYQYMTLRLYRQDPRLHPKPHKFYKDFPMKNGKYDWDTFFQRS